MKQASVIFVLAAASCGGSTGRPGEALPPGADASADTSTDASADTSAETSDASADTSADASPDTSSPPPDGAPADGADASAGTTAAYRSGSRLRAHVWDGGGGALVLIDWYDSTLAEHCTFQKAQDGEIRCLPPLPSLGPPGAYFADAACTQRAYVANPGDVVPSFFISDVDETSASCGAATVRSVGAQQGTTGYALGAMGQCYAFATSVRVFATAIAPPTTFERAAEAIEPHAGALDAAVLVGDDGSRQVSAPVDRTRATTCQVIVTHEPLGTAEPCIPSPSGETMGGLFGDPSCQAGVALPDPFWALPVLSLSSCAPPAYAITRTSSSCASPVVGVWALGTAVSQLYQGGPGACSVANAPPPPPGLSYYAETSAIDLATIPVGQSATLGTGRLGAAVLASTADASTLGSDGERFWDTISSEWCSPTPFDDGVTRCVGDDTVAVSLSDGYSDPACTQPIATGSVPCGSPKYATTPGSNGAVGTVYAVAGPGGPVYKMVNMGYPPQPVCELTTSGPSWSLGAAIAPDTLYAHVNERTE